MPHVTARGAVVSVAVAVALAGATSCLGAAGGAPATVRTAWFYGPPTDGTTVATLASTSSVVILHRGNEGYAARLRAAGYRGRIYQYVDAADVQGPPGRLHGGTPCDSAFVPLRSQIAWSPGDFCRYFDPNEDWFLHNGAGERLVYDGDYVLNPGSPGLRAFFADRLRQAFAGDPKRRPFDGVFLDDVWNGLLHPTRDAANADGTVREYASDAAYAAAMAGFLDTVRAALHSVDATLIGNVGGISLYPPHLDGYMYEAFAASWHDGYSPPGEVESEWRQVAADTAAGKPVILVAQSPDRGDTQRLHYALAAYMMVAGDRVSFRYGDVAAANAYDDRWTYPIYDLRLGTPLGPRVRVGAAAWRRSFSRGCVTVDLAAHSAAFSARPCAARR